MDLSFQTVYGIEYDGGRISVAKARRRRGGSDLQVLLDHADPASGWPGVSAEINTARKHGSVAVAFSAPASDSFIRPVEVPFSSPAKARAVLPSLLDVQLPFPLEQCVYDFGVFDPSAGGKVNALAVAMLKNRLQEIIREIDRTGVDAELVVPEALALWRFLSAQAPRTGASPRIVVHLAADRTVAVAGRDNRPLASFSSRTSWVGASEASREKLVSRLKQFVAGFNRGEEGSAEFVFCGAGASGGSALAADLGAEKTRVRNIEVPALMASAIASYALDSGGLPLNLRHGEFESPALVAHRRRRDRKALSLVATAAAFLIAVSTAAKVAVNQKLEKVNAEIAEVARAMLGGPAQKNFELYSVQNDPVIGGWINPVAQPLFVELVKTSAGAGIALDTVMVGKEKAVIRGYSSDWNDAAALTNALASRTRWNVMVDRADAGTDEKVHFEVSATR